MAGCDQGCDCDLNLWIGPMIAAFFFSMILGIIIGESIDNSGVGFLIFLLGLGLGAILVLMKQCGFFEDKKTKIKAIVQAPVPRVFGNRADHEVKVANLIREAELGAVGLPIGLLPTHWSCVVKDDGGTSSDDQGERIYPDVENGILPVPGAVPLQLRLRNDVEKRVEVAELVAFTQRLFDESWEKITTRDREYSRVQKLQVLQVFRNENIKLWCPYWQRREDLLQHGRCSNFTRNVRTSIIAQEPNIEGELPREEMCFPRLKEACNEAYLFHGTSPKNAESICEHDFSTSFAGSRSGGAIYGPGLYFAENSSKADEYAHSPEGDVRSMLICRVALGNILTCTADEPDVIGLCNQIERSDYHSILGDRTVSRGTYREFVIFDNDQCYPEYLVKYRRCG